MSSDVSFQLDTDAGAEILQGMALATVERSANAIAARAQSMAASISSNPPEITVTSGIGTIKRGMRAIATVRAVGKDSHQSYVGHTALSKAKDAGKVN